MDRVTTGPDRTIMVRRITATGTGIIVHTGATATTTATMAAGFTVAEITVDGTIGTIDPR